MNPLANYSDERRQTVLSYLRGAGIVTHPSLSHDAKLLAAVGAIICDDEGRFSKADLALALRDPSIANYAGHLLHEAAGVS